MNAVRLSEEGQELRMTIVSLARIMYGTNEDLHARQPRIEIGLSVLSSPTVSNGSMLQQLLHKAWSHLTRKS
jgi:hypothetical protein